MSINRFRLGWATAKILLSLVPLPFIGTANASTYQQIYKFPGNSYCCFPESLIRAPNGSLFGVQGANYFSPFDRQQGAGTGIFELDPPAAGQAAWTYKVIYSYTPDYPQPGQPPGYMNPELLMDKAGNLYFGTGTGVYVKRTASVVKLSPPAPGTTTWTQTILYDHHSPTGANIGSFHLTYINSSGDLYGYDDKAVIAGVGGGSVFRVKPPAAGETQGKVSILTRFGDATHTGYATPFSLAMSDTGSFYGLAENGVTSDGHIPLIAFRLSPPATGQTAWTRTTLYTFPPSNYGQELGPIIIDRSLNIYGVGTNGDASSTSDDNAGFVYKLSPPAAGLGAWQQSVIYKFETNPFTNPVGAAPLGALVNWHGLLLGAATNGGRLNSGEGCTFGCGTLFRLAAVAPGSPIVPWKGLALYQFRGAPYDGAKPIGPVVTATQSDGSMAIFGVTLAGGHQNGEDGNGIVYELIP